jgi:putative ABC transport system permease protein
MIQDLRYTIRAMIKRPSFAAGTILVLGLAVGVNTAVFSLINALLLQPLPVRAPNELAFLYYSSDRTGSIVYMWYPELRQKLDVFSDLAARSADAGRLRIGSDVMPLQGESVTPNYFDLLGVRPIVGRTLASSEATPSAPPVAIVSESLWRSQFAADPAILGRTLRIDVPSQYSGRYTTWRDYTIVGVMPASFTGTGNPWQPSQYWVLIEQRETDYRAAWGDLEKPGYQSITPIGRLKPGATFAQARPAVVAAANDILQHTPLTRRAGETFLLFESRRIRLPFAGLYYMDMPRITATLGVVASLLLIIAGANLAGMLLARGVSRRAEIAIRLSLGIGRVRLIRQLTAESVLVAIGGGCAGLLIARVLVGAALQGFPSQIPGSSGMLAVVVPVDLRVIGFAFGTGLMTAIVVGLAPAVQAMRIDLLPALTGASPTSGVGRSRMRRIVLIPQIALSLVLLLVTGVFVRSLLRLEMTHPGYDARHVVTLDVQIPQRPITNPSQAKAEGAAMREMQARIVQRLRTLPGVTSAAVTFQAFDGVPLAALGATIIARSDYETTRQYRGVTVDYVSAGYFETLGIPLRRGRVFDARDRPEDATTVVVSERLANELWPGRDPIGQQFAPHSPDSPYPIRWLDVVGVVGSATRPLDEYPRPVFYRPIETSPLMGTTFLLRGTPNPAELAAAAKQAIAGVEPAAIVAQARPLEETVSGVRYPRRFSAALLGASGTAALLLAAIGVFALMSYAVAQRVGEIGVRMVLGAQRRDIIRLVIADGAGVVVAGIAIGFALAFAAIRFASHAIVPLPDADAATFVAVPLVLIAAVVVACYLPARRAARVDPLVVLRAS